MTCEPVKEAPLGLTTKGKDSYVLKVPYDSDCQMMRTVAESSRYAPMPSGTPTSM